LATTHDLEKRGRVGSALLEHAGDIYLALGQAAEAEAFWQRALEAGGEVQRLTAKIESARG
jgi:predicted negative regulator of RcsB-dependent stress response